MKHSRRVGSTHTGGVHCVWIPATCIVNECVFVCVSCGFSKNCFSMFYKGALKVEVMYETNNY